MGYTTLGKITTNKPLKYIHYIGHLRTSIISSEGIVAVYMLGTLNRSTRIRRIDEAIYDSLRWVVLLVVEVASSVHLLTRNEGRKA